MSDDVHDEPEPEETTDRYGHPRDGARDRLVDRGPEEIGWAQWIMLRPYLAAYLMLGLAFLAPLVIVSINYGRVSSQNQAISRQSDRLADVVAATQTNREEFIRRSCAANNQQNAAIMATLRVFHVNPARSPRLARALAPLAIIDCEAQVRASRPQTGRDP